MSRRGALGRATLTYATAEIGARGAWFALVLALGCLLPQREFGAWSLLMAFAGLLEIGLTLGLHGPAVRWLYDRDEASYQRVLFTLLLVWLGASAVLALTLDRVGLAAFHHLVDALPWLPYGRLSLGVAWLGAAGALPLAMLAANQRAGAYAGLRVATVLSPVAGVLGALALGRADTAGVLTGQLLGAAPLALVALGVGFAASRPKPALAELRPMLAFGLPVLPHMMAWWVLSWSDRWLIERLMDLDNVAIYHMAYLPALGVLLLGGALNRAWYPLLYRQLDALDRAETGPGEAAYTTAESLQPRPATEAGQMAWDGLTTQAAAFLAALATLGAGVALWGGELLRMLPADGYQDSPGLVAFTVTGTTAGLLYLLPHNLLYHHRRTGRIPLLTVTAAVVNIALNLVLIPHLGPLGAAVATVLAYALLAVLFYGAAQRVSRTVVGPRGVLRATAPGLAALVLAMLLGALDPAGWVRVTAELAASGALAWTLYRTGAVALTLRLFRSRARS